MPGYFKIPLRMRLMGRKSYTMEQINRIIRLRVTGWHPIDIARIEERSLNEIRRLLSVEKKKRGIDYPILVKGGTKWTAELLEDHLRQRGDMNYKQMAARIGISAPRLSFLMAKRATIWSDYNSYYN